VLQTGLREVVRRGPALGARQRWVVRPSSLSHPQLPVMNVFKKRSGGSWRRKRSTVYGNGVAPQPPKVAITRFAPSELWKSDGTAGGTVMVKDINTTTVGASSSPENLVTMNGELYFSADDGVDGREVWQSDGTAAGTNLLKDVAPGSRNSSPESLTAYDGTLYFAADDGTNGEELWKSDGTTEGTVLLANIDSHPGADSFPTRLVGYDGILFFAADDGLHGDELWQSDGTTAGTMLVGDINPGAASSEPQGMVGMGVISHDLDPTRSRFSHGA